MASPSLPAMNSCRSQRQPLRTQKIRWLPPSIWVPASRQFSAGQVGLTAVNAVGGAVIVNGIGSGGAQVNATRNAQVHVGNAGSLANIDGLVYVASSDRTGQLTVDDSSQANTTASLFLTGSAPGILVLDITAPAARLIAYNGNQVQASFFLGLNNQLTIENTGIKATGVLNLGGGSTDDVQATSGPLTIYEVDNAGVEDTVNVGSTGQSLDPIVGSVSIYGSTKGYDQLNVYDQNGNADTGASEYFLTGTSLYRPYAGAINFQGMSEVYIEGATSGSKSYDIGATLSGSAPAFVSVPGEPVLPNKNIDLIAGAGSNEITVLGRYYLDSEGQVHSGLEGVQHLNVDGAGADTLTVDESGDLDAPGVTRQAQTISLINNTVSVLGGAAASVGYSQLAGSVLSLSYAGVSTLVVQGDAAGNSFLAGDADDNLDRLPAKVTLQGSGKDSLRLDDAANAPDAPITQTSPRFTITGNSVTRTNVVTFDYLGVTQTTTLTSAIDFSGLATVEIDGGATNNTFAVTGAAPGVSTTIHGGSATNTLDYFNFKGNVIVDLPIGTATGLSGGISNIQDVYGSRGDDILVGNGGNVLTGGTGRNLLIAGPTASTLIGNSGQDILVGGAPVYDADPKLTAIDAIMAEWSRTDLSYAARVQDLLDGGGLNGSDLLDGANFLSNGGNNTLTGGAGLDLFYGLLPANSATPDKTDWNPSQGEVFVDSQRLRHQPRRHKARRPVADP